MRPNLSVRVLTVVALLIALLVVPGAVQAAPRLAPEDDGSPSFVLRAWEWISNLWGAGGGSWEPTGRTDPTTAVGTISAPQAEAVRVDRGVETARDGRSPLRR